MLVDVGGCQPEILLTRQLGFLGLVVFLLLFAFYLPVLKQLSHGPKQRDFPSTAIDRIILIGRRDLIDQPITVRRFISATHGHCNANPTTDLIV